MARFSTWSPYVQTFSARAAIYDSAGRPAAIVDKIHKLRTGFTVRPLGNTISGFAASIPETPVHPKKAIVDRSNRVIAVVEGVFRVYPGYAARYVTAAEAALS